MNTTSRIPLDTSPTGWYGLLRRPSTRLGWWSVGLAVTSVVLNFINSPILTGLIGSNLWRVLIGLPFSFVMLSCGLVAGDRRCDSGDTSARTLIVCVARAHTRAGSGLVRAWRVPGATLN